MVPFLYSNCYRPFVRFEFDPAKSALNLARHGVDFDQAQALWDDEDCLEIPARTQDEPRWIVLGRIEGRVWAAIVTNRQGTVRIISVRRARPAEEALYEG
ncbi:MAG: BrnT family toxin [Candidatus Nanopelagicales bacterium]